MMDRRKFIRLLSLAIPASSFSKTFPQKTNTDLPNIIFIMADNLGYGDLGCYNPESRVPAPNLDNMAKEGKLFTDAHNQLTVCTPGRYSLMTGRMAFRTGFPGVLTGAGGPCLIEKSRLTLPGMLCDKGGIRRS